MKYDITILATNQYQLNEIINENIRATDGYIYDEQGAIIQTSNYLYQPEHVFVLINLLFNNKAVTKELFNNGTVTVLDLSSNKTLSISFDQLELDYPKWLEETGRENTMDEYGMLIDFLGRIQQHADKAFLLMIITKID